MADVTFPQFNVPFPYASLPDQLAASFVPPNQQFSNGSQYGRWNGVNNNAFGLFPGQFQSLFGSPTAPPMQFQAPYGNNGYLGSNQGPGSNPGMSPPQSTPPANQPMPAAPGTNVPAPGMYPPPLNPGQSPFQAGLLNPPAGYSGPPGGTQPPAGTVPSPTNSPIPGSLSSNNKMAQVPPGFYNYGGSAWGGNGPIQASSLGQNDRMYLNALMHIPGMSGPISQMIGGSNGDARNAVDNINATNPAALNGYDFNSYNGPLKQQFAQFAGNIPGGYQNPITGQYSTQGLPQVFQNYFANNPTQAQQYMTGGVRAVRGG